MLNKQLYIRPQLLLICAWIVVVFFDERIMQKFFLSNLIAIGLGLIAIMFSISRGLAKSIYIITGLLLTAWAIAYLQFGLQPGAFQEFFKIFLIIIGGLAVSQLFSTETFEQLLKPFAIVMGAYLFLQAMVIGTPDYNDLRFGLYFSYGNPNTVGFLISICIVLLLYCYRTTAIWKWLLLIFLCALLTKTYSRSAIFGMGVGMIFAFLFRRKEKLTRRDLSCFAVMFLIFTSLYILCEFGHQIDYMPSRTFLGYTYHPHFPHFHKFTIYNIGRFSIADVQKTHLSGRLTTWLAILQMIVSHPKAWLTGFGPGLVTNLNLLYLHYPCIDSLVLNCFYSYGVIGLFISLWFCIKLLITKSQTHRYQIMKAIFGFMMVFTLLVNNTTSASQVLLYGILLVGFILSKEKQVT